MNNVSIDNLKPGMILAQPVRNHQGVLLLEAGARITKKNIRIFKSWGIFQVTIKGRPIETENRAGDMGIRLKQSIEKDLKEKFRDVLDDPVMVQIFNAAGKQLMRVERFSEGDDEYS